MRPSSSSRACGLRIGRREYLCYLVAPSIVDTLYVSFDLKSHCFQIHTTLLDSL